MLLWYAMIDRVNHPLYPLWKRCLSSRLCEWTSCQQAKISGIG